MFRFSSPGLTEVAVKVPMVCEQVRMVFDATLNIVVYKENSNEYIDRI